MWHSTAFKILFLQMTNYAMTPLQPSSGTAHWLGASPGWRQLAACGFPHIITRALIRGATGAPGRRNMCHMAQRPRARVSRRLRTTTHWHACLQLDSSTVTARHYTELPARSLASEHCAEKVAEQRRGGTGGCPAQPHTQVRHGSIWMVSLQVKLRMLADLPARLADRSPKALATGASKSCS